MKQSSRHLLVGLFVLGGFVLFALGCILFGGSQLFAKKIYFETYFASSVQGLDVSGPVKFRGMKIGKVESIGFAGSDYDSQTGIDTSKPGVHRALSYIRVVCSIDLKRHPHFNEKRLRAMTQRGLRAKLDLQGITGVVFINLDLLREETQEESLLVPWKPDTLYIPSVPNTLQSLVSVIEGLSYKVESIDLPKAVNTLTRLLEHADSSIVQSDVPKLMASFTTLGETLNRQAVRLDTLLSQIDTAHLGSQIRTLADHLTAFTAELRLELPKMSAATGETLQRTQTLLTHADTLVREASATLKGLHAQLDTPTLGNDLAATLSTFARTSAALEALVEEIRTKPSRLLFDRPLE